MESSLKEKHLLRLLENLKDFCDEKLFCDLVLIACKDGTRIPVHRNVLAASSRYFKAMFVSGMKESQEKEIFLNAVDGDTLQLLVDFCYTGEIEVTSKNVEALLAIVSHYEFVDIETECSAFLESSLTLDKENCLWYYWIACVYTLNELKVESKHLVETLFMTVKNTDNFLLLDFSQLYEIIESAELVVSHEEEIFSAVMAWINHDASNRGKHIAVLFAEIRFTQMDKAFLINEVHKVMLTNNLESMYEDIMTYNQNPIGQPNSIQKYLLKPRTALLSKEHLDTQVFAFIHDANVPGILTREIYSISQKAWKVIDVISIPIVGSIYAMAQSRNSWYLFDENGQITCIDMISLNLTPVTTVLRRNYTVAIHNDNIYIIAGQEYNADSNCYDLPSKLIEKYDLRTGEWFTCPSLANYKLKPVANLAMNKIYCGDRDTGIIECVNLDSRDVRMLKGSKGPLLTQMICRNEKLCTVTEFSIIYYHLTKDAWEDRTLCFGRESVLSDRQSNDLFLTKKYKTNWDIERYCAETTRSFNFGHTWNTYDNDSQLFLFYNHEIEKFTKLYKERK